MITGILRIVNDSFECLVSNKYQFEIVWISQCFGNVFRTIVLLYHLLRRGVVHTKLLKTS